MALTCLRGLSLYVRGFLHCVGGIGGIIHQERDHLEGEIGIYWREGEESGGSDMGHTKQTKTRAQLSLVTV
jgi:hypothetical protein